MRRSIDTVGPGNLRNPAGPPPWGVVSGDSQNGKGVVNMGGKDSTAADVGPNATLTKLIAMPAGATTLSYDVSAHNRPNSNVRYRVLINGQVLRDEVLWRTAARVQLRPEVAQHRGVWGVDRDGRVRVARQPQQRRFPGDIQTRVSRQHPYSLTIFR